MSTRILVVDDSRHFRSAASELLAARGFESSGMAADGAEALTAVARSCPDGILLDINLPGPDGFAVATILASACPAARIVLTSSDVEDVPGEVLVAHGAVAFVPKTRLATVDLQGLFTPGDR